MKRFFIHLIFGCFVVGVGIMFFNVVRSSSYLSREVQAQTMKTNSLIQELGETRDENQKLFDMVQQYVSEKDAADATEETKRLRPVENVAPVLSEEDLLRTVESKVFLIVGHNKLLADSIMLATVHADGEMRLVSIPRDLYFGGRRINSYLSKYGADELKQQVEKIAGVKIDKYVVFSMNAFEMLVDAIGGIDVMVEKNIYDRAYPNGRGGYMVFQLSAGVQHLSGAQALMFARSRHSTSDFDRARRQQTVLASTFSALKAQGVMSDLGMLKSIYEKVSPEIQTDIGITELYSYANIFRGVKKFTGEVLTSSNYLVHRSGINGAYLLFPKGDDYEQLGVVIRSLLGI